MAGSAASRGTDGSRTSSGFTRYLQFCTDHEHEYGYDPLDSTNDASSRSIGQRYTLIAAGIAAGILDEL